MLRIGTTRRSASLWRICTTEPTGAGASERRARQASNDSLPSYTGCTTPSLHRSMSSAYGLEVWFQRVRGACEGHLNVARRTLNTASARRRAAASWVTRLARRCYTCTQRARGGPSRTARSPWRSCRRPHTCPLAACPPATRARPWWPEVRACVRRRATFSSPRISKTG